MTTIYADIHVKINKDIKDKSERILDSIGISMSDLINMTLRRVIYERQIPFSTRVLPDDAPKSISIESTDDFKKYLDEMIREDDGVRMSEDEVWANIQNHINEPSSSKERNEKIQSRVYD